MVHSPRRFNQLQSSWTLQSLYSCNWTSLITTGITLQLVYPYVQISVSCHGSLACWLPFEEMSSIWILIHFRNFTLKKLGLLPPEEDVFWNSLLSTRCSIANYLRWQYKQTKRLWWFILRYSQHLSYAVIIVRCLMNCKVFGRKRRSWLIEVPSQLLSRGTEKPVTITGVPAEVRTK